MSRPAMEENLAAFQVVMITNNTPAANFRQVPARPQAISLCRRSLSLGRTFVALSEVRVFPLAGLDQFRRNRRQRLVGI
jgi:hypothetical protein